MFKLDGLNASWFPNIVRVGPPVVVPVKLMVMLDIPACCPPTARKGLPVNEGQVATVMSADKFDAFELKNAKTVHKRSKRSRFIRTPNEEGKQGRIGKSRYKIKRINSP